MGMIYRIVNKYNVTLYICHLRIDFSRDCRFCKSRRWHVPSKGGPRWRRVPRLLWQLLLQERGWPKISTTINSNVVTFRPRYLMNGSVLKSLWPCCSWLEYIEIVVLFKKKLDGDRSTVFQYCLNNLKCRECWECSVGPKRDCFFSDDPSTAEGSKQGYCFGWTKDCDNCKSGDAEDTLPMNKTDPGVIDQLGDLTVHRFISM